MSDLSNDDHPLLPVFDHLLRQHPLPWTVDFDWTWEVIADDGTIIAKCMKPDQAEAIVSYAKERQAQLDKEVKQFVRCVESGEEV